MTTVLYIQCNLFSIAIVLVMFFSRRKISITIANRHIFNILLLSTMTVLILDSITWLLEGASFPYIRIFYLVVINIQFVMQFIPCYLWMRYCQQTIHPQEKMPKNRLVALPLVFGLILVFINIFTGIVCTVNQENYYQRGPWFPVIAVISLTYLISSFIMAVKACHNAKGGLKQQYKYLAFFPIFPIVGVLLQVVFYGLESIWIWVVYALLLVYINVQNQRLEQELTKNRISIIMSQVQPHFLFNSLTAIYNLCDTDPAAAQNAISNFSQYLRGNLDSINRTEPVPFENELRHIKIYLSLEKMRFAEKLDIVYQIEADNFKLPPLTIQPLIENAVKHGIGKSENNGTVKLSTREYENRFEITVSDNGAGFDPSQPKNDGKTHTGIESVKQRLWIMCQATLEINSVQNTGTTAVITLPKEKIN